MQFYIKVLDIDLFNTLIASVQDNNSQLEARRKDGYYILYTDDVYLWRELLLYGQILAQEQEAFFEADEIAD